MELDTGTAARIAAEWRRSLKSHGAHEPDWVPLEQVLPIDQCGGFMFMGYRAEIRSYKHGLTRRYLHLDSQGKAYRWIEATSSYQPIALEDAIDHVFEGLAEMGFARSTIYDEELRRQRQKSLREAGWTVVSLDEP